MNNRIYLIMYYKLSVSFFNHDDKDVRHCIQHSDSTAWPVASMYGWNVSMSRPNAGI